MVALPTAVLLALVALATPVSPAATPAQLPTGRHRLTLSPLNAINSFGVPVSGGGAGGVGALLDEQALAGDPASGAGGSVTSAWMPGYEAWYYPWVSAIIDLGAPCPVEQVGFCRVSRKQRSRPDDGGCKWVDRGG